MNHHNLAALAADKTAARRPGLVDRLCATPMSRALVFLAFALLVRSIQFGNPVVQPDDQFYLLTGDRLLQGYLPYIDIWDRKPVGLFILFAGIRLLGGDGVIQYQLVATLFAALTACVIGQIALRFTTKPAALIAGLIYLLYLCVFGGEAGQSPVFYNLFTALAALSIVWILDVDRFRGREIALGCGAMALMAVAMQIKYPALFEGAFFGLALLWLAHLRGVRLPGLICLAVLWLVIALAPTAAAWGFYAARGYNEAFVYANFTSIFDRGSPPVGVVFMRWFVMVAQMLPLLVAAYISSRPKDAAGRIVALPRHGTQKFVRDWSIVAVGAVMVFGSYYDHYALPMLLPLSIAAAPLLSDFAAGVDFHARHRRLHIPAVAFVAFVAFVLATVAILTHQEGRGRGKAVHAMAAYLKPRLKDCLFVFAAEPILYHLTGSCLPGRWPFPDHLNNRVENNAIGVDPLAEVTRIMAGKPEFVVETESTYSTINWRTWNYMQAQLARDYEKAFVVPVGVHFRIVYRRLKGH